MLSSIFMLDSISYAVKHNKRLWRFVSYTVISPLSAVKFGGPPWHFQPDKSPLSVVGPLSPILVLQDAGVKVRQTA